MNIIKVLWWVQKSNHVYSAETPFGDYLILFDKTRKSESWVLKTPSGKVVDYYITAMDCRNRAQSEFDNAVTECFNKY